MSNAAGDTLQKVSNEFEGEVLADLQEGKEKALTLIEAAERETRESISKLLENSVKQAEAVKRQIVGAAELEARNSQLKVLEKAVSGAFSDAVSLLSGIEKKRYEEALTRMVGEGTEVLGQDATVSCSSRDKELVSTVVKRLSRDGAKLTLAEQSVETAGGVVLTTPDGSVRFDNTFEARLERLRPTLRKEVADLLGG